MRTRAVLLLVLASALGVFAWQQATKPPRYTGGPPPLAPRVVPAPAPVVETPVEVGEPPEAEMQEIAEAFSQRQGDRIEAKLRALNERYPGNARILSHLSRLEYHRAIRGRAQPSDMLSMDYDYGRMNAAREWAEMAVAADPELADAWLTRARVELAGSSIPRGVEMLERAEALEPGNVLVLIQKGNALRSLAAYHGDASYLPLAVEAYERALQQPIESLDEYLALRAIGETWKAMGDDDKAIAYLTRSINGFEGSDKAFTLDVRARTHLEAGNVDAAMQDSRAALEIMRFGVAAQTLADAHLVKAGLYMRNGQAAAALPHLTAALSYDPNPAPHAKRLASRASTFPAVYALLTRPMRAAGFSNAVPLAVGEAAWFITPTDLRKLHALGVTFDVSEEMTGTVLHRAIANNNVDAVRELLKLGADASLPLADGSTTQQAVMTGNSPQRKQIRKMVFAKLGTPPGWTEPGIDLPEKGRWYQADRTVGVIEGNSGKTIEAGMTVLASSRCSTPGRPFICFTFYTKPDEYYGTILVPIERMEDFRALREVDAPE